MQNIRTAYSKHLPMLAICGLLLATIVTLLTVDPNIYGRLTAKCSLERASQLQDDHFREGVQARSVRICKAIKSGLTVGRDTTALTIIPLPLEQVFLDNYRTDCLDIVSEPAISRQGKALKTLRELASNAADSVPDGATYMFSSGSACGNGAMTTELVASTPRRTYILYFWQ